MNCSECKTNLYHLLENSNDALAGQLKKHIAACQNCYNDYESMLDLETIFKEGTNLQAPLSLKTSILSEIDKLQADKKAGKLSTMKKIAVGIAAILILVLIIPFVGGNSNSAKATALLKNAISALENVRTMIMKMDIRTEPDENFHYINKDEPMMTHILTGDFKNKKWRIDKTGRTAFMTNDTTYMFMKNENLAVYFPGDARGIMGWFSILLHPTSILREENAQAHKKGSNIKLNETGDKIYLTVQSKAEGVFINDVGRNSSIGESDNRREYVFDKKTQLLKSFKIYLLENKGETLMLEMKDIQYNVTVDESSFSLHLPPGVQWEEFKLPEKNEKFNSLTPEEVTKIALTDLSKNDFTSHPEIWGSIPKPLLKIINENYASLQIITIGKAFQSGTYPGYYVPYKVKLKTGEIKAKNLAIRNDNPDKSWMLDGGY